MGFVIQVAAGARRPVLLPGVIGQADNAASGHLGAKSAARDLQDAAGPVAFGDGRSRGRAPPCRCDVARSRG